MIKELLDTRIRYVLKNPQHPLSPLQSSAAETALIKTACFNWRVEQSSRETGSVTNIVIASTELQAVLSTQ